MTLAMVGCPSVAQRSQIGRLSESLFGDPDVAWAHAPSNPDRTDCDRLIRALLTVDGDPQYQTLAADPALVDVFAALRWGRPPVAGGHVDPEHVIVTFEQAGGLEAGAIRTRVRTHLVAGWRHWAIWVIARHGGYTLAATARVLGMDHRSMHHAVRKCDRLWRGGTVPAEVLTFLSDSTSEQERPQRRKGA